MWEQTIIEYADHLRAAGASGQTVRLRCYWLRRFAAAKPDLSPWHVTLPEIVGWLALPSWAPETRRSARASLTTFYRWAHLSGLITADPAAGLPPVRVPRGVPRPAPADILTVALTTAPDRVRLMILLAAFAGLRRAEIARVHTRDIADGILHVHGKGGRRRIIPLHPRITAELGDRKPGWLFPGRDNGHLSAGHVGRLLARHLGGEPWTAHTLRHRFASEAYSGSHDIRAVQELLGHANVATTMVYTAIGDGALRAAVLAVR